MPIIDQVVRNFNIFEDGIEFFGMAKVTLPKITNLSNTISGAGISGNIDVVTIGHVDAMEMTLEFRIMTASAVRLAEPRLHTLELRAAQQSEDNVSGTINIGGVKYVVVVAPKELDLGTLAPSSPANVSGKYVCRSIAGYFGGELWLDIDPRNGRYLINGVDYLADERKALGK